MMKMERGLASFQGENIHSRWHTYCLKLLSTNTQFLFQGIGRYNELLMLTWNKVGVMLV